MYSLCPGAEWYSLGLGRPLPVTGRLISSIYKLHITTLPPEIVDRIVGYLTLRDWIVFTQLTGSDMRAIPYRNKDALCVLSRTVGHYTTHPQIGLEQITAVCCQYLINHQLDWLHFTSTVQYFISKGARDFNEAAAIATTHGYCPPSHTLYRWWRMCR